MSDDGERGKVERTSNAGGQCKSVLRLRGKPLDFSRHEVDDVVSHRRPDDGLDSECPSAEVVVELEQSFLLECLQELLNEKGIPIRLLQDETGQRLDLRQLSMKGVPNQESEIRKVQGTQEYVIQAGTDRFQSAQRSNEWMAVVHFIIAIGADQEEILDLGIGEKRFQQA